MVLSEKDSGIVIAQKLKTLVAKFGCSFTEEEALEATKKYIESFNGNYTYMRILKYFILKDEVKIGEEGNRYVEQVSELANFLENEMEQSQDFCDIR